MKFDRRHNDMCSENELLILKTCHTRQDYKILWIASSALAAPPANALPKPLDTLLDERKPRAECRACRDEKNAYYNEQNILCQLLRN